MAAPGSRFTRATGVLGNRQRLRRLSLGQVGGSRVSVEQWLGPWIGPQLISTTVTTVAGFSGTHVYQLPTVAIGDRLVMVSSYLGSLAEYTPTTDLSAWTSFLASELNSFHVWRGYTIYIADAAAVTAWSGTTVTFNGANGGKSTCVVARVASGDGGGLNVGFDHSGPSTTASDAAPNPPQLVVDWGTDQNLWLTFATFGSGGDSATTQPQDYQDLVQGGAAADQCTTAMSHRYKVDVGEDPGSFALTGTENNQALTFAIRPLQPPPVVFAATPKPIVVSDRPRRRPGFARVTRNMAEPPPPAVATPRPVVIDARPTRARGESMVLRAPTRAASTPKPIVRTRRPARRAPSFAFERSSAMFTPVATPKPVVATERPRRRPVSQLLLRSLDKARPVATPEPRVVTSRPRRRPVSQLFRRNPAEPPVEPVATPHPIVFRAPLLRRWRPAPILGRSPDKAVPVSTPRPEVITRRPVRSLGRLLLQRNPQPQAAVVAVATPNPLVLPARARRARSRLIALRNGRLTPVSTRGPVVISRRPSRRPRPGVRLVRAPVRVVPRPKPIVVSRRARPRTISELIVVRSPVVRRDERRSPMVVGRSPLHRGRRSVVRLLRAVQALVTGVDPNHISVTVRDDSHLLTIREDKSLLVRDDSHLLTIQESYTVEIRDSGHTDTEMDQG